MVVCLPGFALLLPLNVELAEVSFLPDVFGINYPEDSWSAGDSSNEHTQKRINFVHISSNYLNTKYTCRSKWKFLIYAKR